MSLADELEVVIRLSISELRSMEGHQYMRGLKKERVVTQAMLENLPEPVQRYMNFTDVLGKPWINNVVLRQSGKFRMGFERPWMPMRAVQRFVTDPPSFVWNARFRVGGIPLLRASDEYSRGHGQMMGKLAGLITLFDVRGDELDQGAMVRYLSEMIWFPIAYLGENISWERVDSDSADVSFSDAGRTVTGRMFFDHEGRPINFTAKRYREIDGDFTLDQWSTPITGYGVRAGLNIPILGRAEWNLSQGNLVYVDLAIEEIKYNANG